MSHTVEKARAPRRQWVQLLRRGRAVGCLLSILVTVDPVRAQECLPPVSPRSSSGAVLASELAALPGSWVLEVIATRGRWGLNPKPDSLGRARSFLQLAPVDTASAAIRTIGIRPDSLRPLGGRHFAAPPTRGDAPPSPGSIGVWMFGRTLYAGHPGGKDAMYDAFQLAQVDSLSLRGWFFRSWGITVPLGVSGDSAREPAGYFCARRSG